MARLYYPGKLAKNKQIIIDELQQVHYVCDVLRVKAGDEIFLFDGRGNEYCAQIQELSRKKVGLSIKTEVKTKTVSAVSLTIACALPKQRSRFDDLIDKLAQLGVDEIIPMITQRVIVRWNDSQRQRHSERWNKIAQGACIQSGRNKLPIIVPIETIEQVLARGTSYKLKLIPVLQERERKSLSDIIAGGAPKSVLVLIGPEGDFTSLEVAQAKQNGFIPACLGDLVLRVDTAAIAVAAFFQLSHP